MLILPNDRKKSSKLLVRLKSGSLESGINRDRQRERERRRSGFIRMLGNGSSIFEQERRLPIREQVLC